MNNIAFTPHSQNQSFKNRFQVKQVGGCSAKTLTSLSEITSQRSFSKQRNAESGRQDIYTRVTNRIIADLEKGNLTWVKP